MPFPTKERVLLLEPNPAHRGELIEQVRSLGYHSEAAKDRDEVLLRLSQAQYPIIVVGPTVDGAEVSDLHVRARTVQPDVVFVSAQNTELKVPDAALAEMLSQALRLYSQSSARRFVNYITREPLDTIFRVLSVNQGESVRAMIRALLMVGVEHDLLECEDLHNAVELADAWDPDVVLLGMPEQKDELLPFVVVLQRRKNDVPVVLITEDDDREFALRAIQVGAQEVLVRDRITQNTLRHTLRVAVERRLARERMQFLENFHPLSGLPNRSALSEHLAQQLNANDGSKRVALVHFNIDRFNALNQSLGAEGGDRIIQEVSDRMHKVVEENEFLGHLIGDEFVLIVKDVPNVPYIRRRTQGFIDTIGSSLVVDGRDYLVTMSAGIAMYPDSPTAERMFNDATQAMRRAKRVGRNQIAFFNHSESWSPEHFELEGDLATAIRESQFELFYQPKLTTDGMPSGAEALLRWRHPSRGIVYPGQFIPLLEETGHIVTVGRWALRTACVQAKSWQDRGMPLSIAINVSARQFQNGNIVEHVQEALNVSQMDPGYLELELTESLLLGDDDSILKILNTLRDMGVMLSLDDFGTGYSSLAYLKRYPMDVLKIDRSFIKDITEERQNLDIVRAIVDLAHTLNLQVTVEGVETQEQLALIRNIGCDAYQGYFAAKPLEVTEFEAWVQRTREALAA